MTEKQRHTPRENPIETDTYIEQGIQVWELNDYEWWAGKSAEDTVLAACKAWGYTDPQKAIDDAALAEGHLPVCNLDDNHLNAAEEGAPADRISYRESIKRSLAAGEPFPRFFCGIDG